MSSYTTKVCDFCGSERVDNMHEGLITDVHICQECIQLLFNRVKQNTIPDGGKKCSNCKHDKRDHCDKNCVNEYHRDWELKDE